MSISRFEAGKTYEWNYGNPFKVLRRRGKFLFANDGEKTLKVKIGKSESSEYCVPFGKTLWAKDMR